MSTNLKRGAMDKVSRSGPKWGRKGNRGKGQSVFRIIDPTARGFSNTSIESRTMRRDAIVFATLTTLIAWSSIGSASERAPNILFVAADDLNDWVGPLRGHPQVKTPTLDRHHIHQRTLPSALVQPIAIEPLAWPPTHDHRHLRSRSRNTKGSRARQASDTPSLPREPRLLNVHGR